jgi:apolipoprotein N-acyltransferase
MNAPAEANLRAETSQLRVREAVFWTLVAAAAFHFAYFSATTTLLIVLYPFALLQLASAESWRKAFYAGLMVGLIIAVGRLDFFWRIFSAGSVALWIVYAFWIGLFAVVARLCLKQLSPQLAFGLLPFIWCGLEYFRSELYYLRFSWLTPGLAFGCNSTIVPLGRLGTYGIGFLLMAIVSGAAQQWRTSRSGAFVILVAGMVVVRLWGWVAVPKLDRTPHTSFQVAGIQMEFPTEKEVLVQLNELNRHHPKTDLLVLSEYTFTEPIPEVVKAWCRAHRKYLIIGGKDPVSKSSFYDSAFVISPAGEVVFRQPKSVPIQFFNDGLPATEQKVWNSPWGKIGICICYDLSYTRVTDRLVQQGAEALIVPTMDVADWGQRQHELHARIAPVRAAEYQIPIFRLASSGISQAVDAAGHVLATAPCPGDGAMIVANLALTGPGRRPLDRWFAPFATSVTAIVSIALLARASAEKRRAKLARH